ncbi:hypothetical protein ACFQ9Y_26315 [Peribacillus simplex]|uniref:hypothetical protein n=1 Tax=Peribacillus simplex TaxID=1478 RepID=UPI00366CB5DC
MNREKYDKLRGNVESLLEKKSSSELIKEGLRFTFPTKGRSVFLFIFLLVIFLLYHSFFIENGDVIKNYLGLVKEINEIVIPTFAVIITGYAIFQALANGTALITLITVDEGEKTKFEIYNKFFFGISILYLFIIVFNLLIYIIFSNVPSDWSIPFFTSKTNNTLAALLISLYIVFIIHSLIELKSFVYNLYQCFKINATTAGIEYLKNLNEVERQRKKALEEEEKKP